MIVADRLTKSYGPTVVLQDVSFVAAPGLITGFLGPNGAGKSTTLRAIVGLVDLDSGSATVLGTNYRRLADPARRVGVLLDASKLHPGRTGRDTLAVTARYLGLGDRRVDEVLDLVGLARRAGEQRVRAYSLGMRQRLGLAHALLGDPEVLILDEPANGLDPEGIRWMRELLLEVAGEGRTVLLSSHLLSEIEKVADRVVVIRRGQVVANGPVSELLGQETTQLRTDDDEKLVRAAARAGCDTAPTVSGSRGSLTVLAPPAVVGDLCRSEGLSVHHLVGVPTTTLEDLVIADIEEEANPSGVTRGRHEDTR